VRKALDAVVSALVLFIGRARRRRPPKDAERILPQMPPEPRAEALAIALLFLAALFAAGFCVEYAISSVPDRTQVFGATLGLSLLCVAAALIVVARRLIVTEELVEPYPPEEHPHEQETISRLVEEAGDRITRKRLFKAGLGAAGGTLGLAAIAPAVSFGPLFHVKEFSATPWRKGIRLVDESSRPYRASDIRQDDFYTAFPEGLSLDGREQVGAPVVLVRLPPDRLRLPPKLHGYDAAGILAYSKICTHAGCAISLYRAPLFQPDEPPPALVCPCHYSTFDVADGGQVTFGPAGRPLPMLPLTIDEEGYLRAAGTFSGEVGPAWWGTRIWGPTP
jgi:quinol---cytochrome c reductase iron-sulfur subunit